MGEEQGLASRLHCRPGMLDLSALLEKVPLADKRLRKRAHLMVQSLIRGHSATSLGLLSPADRTPESFTRGAYRFFDHDEVSLPALQAPVSQALSQLVPLSGQAYVAHDLSVLNYSGHQREEDLIPVGNDRTFGYELYQALCISHDGKPLGAAVTELRNMQGLLSSQSAEVLPFKDHLEQTERAVDAVEKMLPGRCLIHLCDREFDDLCLLRRMADRRYVIRCQHLNRLCTVHGEQRSLSSHIEHAPLSQVGQVHRRVDNTQKTYQLFVGQTVPLRVRVVVSELRNDSDKPLRWVLFTNLSDMAENVVGAYLLRWKVEIRHPWCVLSRVSYVGETGIFVDGASQTPGAIPLHVLLSPLGRSASASRYHQATYTRGGPASRVLMHAPDMREGMVTRRADSKSATGWEGLRAWQRACHGGMVPGAVLVGVAQRAQAA